MKDDDKLFLVKEMDRLQKVVIKLSGVIDSLIEQNKKMSDLNAGMIEFMLQQEVKIRNLEEKANEQE